MKFALKDHLGAAAAIGMALNQAGHTPEFDVPDVFLIDWDGPIGPYREFIDFYRRKGAAILLYPHGAGGANLQYDSLFEPYEVDGQLVVADGEREYLARLGIDRPTREIGWSYCDQIPFRACEEPRRVLFAPTHPMGPGDTYDWRRERNGAIFEELIAGPWKLTVRTILSPEANGFASDVPNVRYVLGSTEISTAEIDVADVVVAGSGTFPNVAIARGAPTVVYGQFEALYGMADEERVPLARQSLYEDLVRYPHDVDDGPLGDVLRAAARNDDAVKKWRDQWIGKPFDPAETAKTIEEFVRDLSRSRVPVG